MRALPVGFAVVVSALGAIASAQDSRVQAPMASPQAVPVGSPSVKALIRGVNDEAHTTDLLIRQLDVQVAVRGAIAETVMDMELLAPPNAGPVEGRVHIDLPAGSVVTGYALDVNGGLVDGSLIDQSTARTAFNRQVRGQVDPGLAEINQTGGFNTRVFPIDGQKGRKLRLRFVTPVSPGDSIRVELTAKQITPRETDDYGEVRWDAVILNQRDEIVATYDVLTLVAKTAEPGAATGEPVPAEVGA